MIAYAKIENAGTHAVSIGTGTNHDFYTALGMTLMDVEQSELDGSWYVAGFAPAKSEELIRKEKAETRLVELQTYLSNTDWYCARYVDAGVEIPAEVKQKRASARSEIDDLREELVILSRELD